LGLICVGSTAAHAQGPDAGIGAVIKAYEVALRNSDTTTVMGLYGKEPAFVPPNSKGLVGREAVQAGYEHVFKAIKVNVTFTIHEVVELGDTAYARTSSTGEVILLASNAAVKDANNELFIFRKEAGQWRIHRYIYNSANPAAGN
jgi:uncharacterized protein (TIGR02246 family)